MNNIYCTDALEEQHDIVSMADWHGNGFHQWGSSGDGRQPYCLEGDGIGTGFVKIWRDDDYE